LAELFVINGICGGTVFFLPDVPTVVGRSAECHVQISDPWISSMHALFERRGTELWVVDLDSRNGTFVGEERVQESRLQPGARVRFGKTEAELRGGAGPAEPKGLIQGENTVIRYLADLVGEAAAPPGAASSAMAEAVVRRRGPSGITASGRRQMLVINEIGRISTSGASLDETLRLILRTLAGTVGAERATVLLLDEKGAMVPHATEPAGADPHLSATVVDEAIRSRAGILTFDAQQDQRFSGSQSVIAEGIRSCMATPIWAENRILGALVLDRTYAEPFTAEDLELATLVGFQAAMAIDRARLADRTRLVDEQRQRLLRHLPPAAAAVVLSAEGEPLAPTLRPDTAVLTVAFLELASLASERPPEEVAARVMAVQEEVRTALFQRGAAVDARMTGGAVAVFGLLQALPDAAIRALAAALEVRDRVAALEAQRPGPHLQVHAGIELGTVLSGNFSTSEQPELRVVGAAAEASLRLAARASAGQLLVGPVAAARGGDEFELSEAGPDGVRALLGPRS